ncbi:hypothetical protein CL633_00980 [bacterium]|nr:hypothetical protein [bacterium]|tara:strand:- start:12474 stop:12815 length:342 start_codon:yes stop_codon:yes gene_type:complete
MTKLEQRTKKYIKENPDVDFDLYLKEQLKDKKFSKYYFQKKAKMELALEVYRTRQKKKITQAQLAKTLRMPQANIARIERAQHMPTLNTLAKIFNALGKSISVKIGRKEVCFG